MADLEKKRVITINGPIASGKQKLAQLFALSCKDPQIVKMPKDSIVQYYQLAQDKNSIGYEDFLDRECRRIINEFEDYLDDDNENDLLIIITDVSALINVLARAETAPKISNEAKDDLGKLEIIYGKLLKKVSHVYAYTEVQPRFASLDIAMFKKDEIPPNFFTLKDIEDQHSSYRIFTNKFLMKHVFLDPKTPVPKEKSKEIHFIGGEIDFHVYSV